MKYTMPTTYHHIVCTAGISLFGAPNLYGKLARDCSGFRFERANPLPAEGFSIDRALGEWERCLSRPPILDTAQNPTSVSAEYSLLHALRQMRRLGPNPRIVIVHTDTLGGRAAVQVLAKVLARDFNAAMTLRCIADFDVSDPVRLQSGLGSFMEIVAGALAEGEPSGTCFAPVGGYKVMTSLGYLAGAYMGFPTAYLHEDSQVLQTIPAVPIQWSIEVLRPVGSALRATLELVSLGDLSAEVRRQIDAHPYLFERLDNHVVRNAFGVFLAHRPELFGVLGPRIWVSPQVVSRCAHDAQATHFVCGQLHELQKQLVDGGSWGELRHDMTFANLKDAPFFLYKGSSNGELVGRAAYRYDSATGDLYVNHVWTDHDIYEYEADKGVGCLDDPNSIAWIDWSETVHPANPRENP